MEMIAILRKKRKEDARDEIFRRYKKMNRNAQKDKEHKMQVLKNVTQNK